MDSETYHSITQFLYKEARLLDTRKYRDWLDMLSPDIVYLAPQRFNRLPERRDEDWAIEKEIDELGYFEDDFTSLTLRVERFYLGTAWAEIPPSRVRHIITNIEAEGDPVSQQGVTVYSNFIVYRNRLAGRTGEEENLVAGCRTDQLRRDGDSWSWPGAPHCSTRSC